MARTSARDDKNVYWQARDKMGLTREEASELLETMPPERVARIEYEQFLPHPDEVLLMSEKYKDSMLCNYYCSQQCPIGQQYVPEIKIKDLSQIVLEMLASLNSMQRQTERLIDISADGIIDNEELKDFICIQRELEKISITVETLQLWAEQMLATGKIDMEQYNTLTQQ
ncbi:MAG: XRE family transcriptional regulator [Oscillospiraceae bacterium]|nr:XRE family transcriptional regulator [Oscillospiraceae bacterium]